MIFLKFFLLQFFAVIYLYTNFCNIFEKNAKFSIFKKKINPKENKKICKQIRSIQKNIIIFHTNTAMRSGLSNQKFFIRSMKINFPIFRVLVDRVKASERQNPRSDIIFASIDGFEVCNALGTFSLKTDIFSDFPPIL